MSLYGRCAMAWTEPAITPRRGRARGRRRCKTVSTDPALPADTALPAAGSPSNDKGRSNDNGRPSNDNGPSARNGSGKSLSPQGAGEDPGPAMGVGFDRVAAFDAARDEEKRAAESG
ncbi:MAG: hypothetical protein ACK5PP_08425 [Acidimicrobiales bacterium]